MEARRRLTETATLLACVLVCFAGVAVSADSAGCTSAPTAAYPVGDATPGYLTTPDGRNRTFAVYVPTGYRSGRSSSLVFFLHGGLGSAQQAQRSYLMNLKAEQENFIVVYPEGYQKTWNGGACCGAARLQNIDDVGFIGRLMDHIESQLCINTRAVFVTGMSNGAMMTYRLACELADRIAAIAPVAGTLTFQPCTPSRPVPVLHIHGMLDLNVPFGGGPGCGLTSVNFTDVPAVIDRMVQIDGCACRWEEDQGDDSCATVYLEEGHTTCRSYGPCTSKATVALCTVENGGHSWPGPNSTTGGLSDGTGCNSTIAHDFLANDHIWQFFVASIESSAAGSWSPSLGHFILRLTASLLSSFPVNYSIDSESLLFR